MEPSRRLKSSNHKLPSPHLLTHPAYIDKPQLSDTGIRQQDLTIKQRHMMDSRFILQAAAFRAAFRSMDTEYKMQTTKNEELKAIIDTQTGEIEYLPFTLEEIASRKEEQASSISTGQMLEERKNARKIILDRLGISEEEAELLK